MDIITEGKGVASPTLIRFAPVEAQFLRITLTKSEEIVHGERRGQPFDYEVPWTMRELQLYGWKE